MEMGIPRGWNKTPQIEMGRSGNERRWEWNAHVLPLEMPIPVGPQLTHSSLGPPKSTMQTASQSVQPFLHGSWSNRQTDKPCYGSNNRLHGGAA